MAASRYLSLLDYQRRAIDSPAPYGWYNWSRQTGKSFTLSLRRILRGLHRRRNQPSGCISSNGNVVKTAVFAALHQGRVIARGTHRR